LRSICIILFKYGKKDIFQKLIEDVVTHTKNLSLQLELYNNVVKVGKSLTLDFDDAYQYIIAKTKLNSSFFVKTCIYSLNKLYIQKFVI
jgi:predicted nucleic acid-binding protein